MVKTKDKQVGKILHIPSKSVIDAENYAVCENYNCDARDFVANVNLKLYSCGARDFTNEVQLGGKQQLLELLEHEIL